ncbi:MAG: ribonuclease III [Pseudomonadota bacterium]|nr:ribonuclease III [Pseudomonadota bacterium]
MASTVFHDRLGHSFARPELLAQALTHRSFGATHNERLEFVGDAVLNCAIAAALFERFPHVPEGDLSRIRANLVNRDTLARLASALDLGASIRFGEGELRSGGKSRPSIIADALEAIFGAIFVDGGFDAARRAIESVFEQELGNVNPGVSGKDAKTRLQEWLQARKVPVPEYTVVDTAGEPHAQIFTVECRVGLLRVITRGEGPSRRVAEQQAAEAAYVAVVAQGAALTAPVSKRGRSAA